jgi:S1-C subfamily serine protease
MLAEHGSIKRGFLGIRSQLMEIPEDAQKVLGRNQTTGLLLINIEEDSPAEKGSLKVGDILTGFNDRPVNDHSQLLGFLTGDVVGNPTKIEILRSGKKLELPVTVEEAEEYTRPSHSRSSHRFLKRRFSHHPPLHSQRTRRRRRP